MSRTNALSRGVDRFVRPLLSVFLIQSLAVAPPLSFAGPTKLAEPVNFSSPDVSFGKRRPVTAADRAAIQSYRSKTPVYSTTFTKPADLQDGWTFVEDDSGSLKSCRKSGNAETSSAGLRFKTLVATDCKSHWSTGAIKSRAKYSYGYFEVSMKIADIKGMNNAVWLTSQDHYEIDGHRLCS